MRTLLFITRFYRGIFLANSLIMLSCVVIIITYGNKASEIIGVLFWFKVVSLALIIYSAVYYKKHELYYYQNLGISKLKLVLVTAILDFTLWAMVLFIAIRAI